jgi:hypothetical protein
MQLSEVIREFGNEVGFRSLETNANGVVHLTIQKVGDLFIDEKYSDEAGGYVFVYLLRVYEHITGDRYRRALELCDYEPNQSILVNPVLHKEQALGFAVRYPKDSFDVNILRKIIERLKILQDRLEG